ncbi:mitochondrial inner membrane protease subunit 1 [Folsomia candida]|uniref:mitochondrial inner membrane protease subunit 1 n=1 Tax=Folsomia candida TaxID=158441 RepID=UPI000B909F77|nr:mitochondrial inner membrane protease subunit 1 [Folsomia candida]
MSRIFSSFAMRSLAIGCATLLTNNYVASFVICTGPSMEPHLNSGNILITEKVSPRLGLVDVGDVVIAKSPEDRRTRICKRIAAKEGDLVIFRHELYQIPKDHVWLLGDNSKNSNDSRSYGPVRTDQIRSKCIFRIWPDINRSVLYQFEQPKLKYSMPSVPEPTTKSTQLTSWMKGVLDNGESGKP